MQIERQKVTTGELNNILSTKQERLGLHTSIDGGQLITLLLNAQTGTARLLEVDLQKNEYPSLTTSHPQFHWFERGLYDMFGIVPVGHPRFKHLFLHEEYPDGFFPLRKVPLPADFKPPIGKNFDFLEVKGEGVYELPVGPIHAGIIEPGHFRFSCYGETIVNLEVRLGYLHRGVEKRLAQTAIDKMHFVAEAVSSDTACANALAHAEAIESVMAVSATDRARYLRSIALEIERLAVHIVDVGGMATDIGLLGISATMGRLRGRALGMADLLSGSRFLRGFIVPGGVRLSSEKQLSQLKTQVAMLRHELKAPIKMFLENQMALERMKEIGVLSNSLANEFGMVGAALRATGTAYDTRQHFPQGAYPEMAPPPASEKSGDIYARELIRITEIWSSLDTLDRLLDNLPGGAERVPVPKTLLKNKVGVGIVEAFRGELIHLIVTDDNGEVARYAVKHPSFNNWAAISIAIRNNLIADFPLCNKSLALSYSGNDL